MAKKGAKNVAVQGGLDKRQATRAPWLNLNGEIVFFCTTVKGITERCFPNPDFRSRSEFKKLMFGHSENHWVSKALMRDQIYKSGALPPEYCPRERI